MPEQKKQPSFGKAAWEVWKRFAHKLGDFQARVLLTVFYAVLVLPLGIVLRLFGDPLRVKRPPEHWLGSGTQTNDLNRARRQW